MLLCERSAGLFPHPRALIRSQAVDLCFIRPNNALPIVYGPVAAAS
jgi:hypothetical protein